MPMHMYMHMPMFVMVVMMSVSMRMAVSVVNVMMIVCVPGSSLAGMAMRMRGARSRTDRVAKRTALQEQGKENSGRQRDREREQNSGIGDAGIRAKRHERRAEYDRIHDRSRYDVGDSDIGGQSFADKSPRDWDHPALT